MTWAGRFRHCSDLVIEIEEVITCLKYKQKELNWVDFERNSSSLISIFSPVAGSSNYQHTHFYTSSKAVNDWIRFSETSLFSSLKSTPLPTCRFHIFYQWSGSAVSASWLIINQWTRCPILSKKEWAIPFPIFQNRLQRYFFISRWISSKKQIYWVNFSDAFERMNRFMKLRLIDPNSNF